MNKEEIAALVISKTSVSEEIAEEIASDIYDSIANDSFSSVKPRFR